MQKILLFYKFVPIKQPDELRKWLTIICAERGLNGRIIISDQGVNGTLGGDDVALDDFIEQMESKHYLKNLAYKRSKGGYADFPKLSVKVRDEIVTFRARDQVRVGQDGVEGGGKYITPDELHNLVEAKGDEIVFFDGRNAYEAEVGHFKNAIIPDVKNTRDFTKEISKPKYKDIKDKPVVTYCTGGIRCEVLSVLMKQEGFKDVYQIDGGIAKYGEKYGDEGLWEGKLYVFDNRKVTSFSDKAKDLGSCVHCQGKTSNFVNCANKKCNQLMLVCKNCAKQNSHCKTCSKKLSAVKNS